MAASKEEIRAWVNQGIEKGAAFVVIKCDTFDYDDYPVYVMPGEDPVVHRSYRNMTRPIECYDLSLNVEYQLQMHRAWNWGEEKVLDTESETE